LAGEVALQNGHGVAPFYLRMKRRPLGPSPVVWCAREPPGGAGVVSGVTSGPPSRRGRAGVVAPRQAATTRRAGRSWRPAGRRSRGNDAGIVRRLLMVDRSRERPCR
jgi:hypothetical protein